MTDMTPYSKQCLLALIFVILMFCGCERPVTTEIVEGNPPRFNFNHPDALSGFFVFRIPKEYVGKESLPGDILKQDSPNMVWEISGALLKRDELITYGVVPAGMTEKYPAKTLVEGGHYFLYCFQSGNGGCSGASFEIRDGKSVRLNGF